MLANEVAVNFNVFGPLVKHWICRNLDITYVVNVEWFGLLSEALSSQRRHCQITSLLAEDIDRCSAFTRDLETVVCFLHFPEIGDVPKKLQWISGGVKEASIKSPTNASMNTMYCGEMRT